jgi:PTH1 family peptidyl-tRNA hydrolase
MRLPFLKRHPAEPPRYLIVGLGNPGPEYQNTRHNVGFRVIDTLATRHRIDARKMEKRALVGYGKIGDTGVLLAKPQTFMNLSGESIAPLMRMVELGPADVIVVYDDMDLPVGRLRLRADGSAGGHNGIKSLIQHLQTSSFPRVRIGVGRPGGDKAAVEHVLSKFGRDEIAPIQDAIERAADAAEAILTDGIERAMNRFNTGPAPPNPPQ